MYRTLRGTRINVHLVARNQPTLLSKEGQSVGFVEEERLLREGSIFCVKVRVGRPVSSLKK